jgi:hypothetical protein
MLSAGYLPQQGKRTVTPLQALRRKGNWSIGPIAGASDRFTYLGFWAWPLAHARQPFDLLVKFELIIRERQGLHNKRFLEWCREARPLKNGGSSETLKGLLPCWAVLKDADYHRSLPPSDALLATIADTRMLRLGGQAKRAASAGSRYPGRKRLRGRGTDVFLILA